MAINFASFLPVDVLEKFDFYNYGHALEILHASFPDRCAELVDALRSFTISNDEILTPGGSESPIPPKFSAILSKTGWMETRITGDLVITMYTRKASYRTDFSDTPAFRKTIKNYIDAHNIDFVKDRVAIDFEWNSKDQTFDRDIFALRTYHECDIISVGVIITRSESLNKKFRELNVLHKYGASTTWIGKLLPRLDSRRHGGCPILAIAIKETCIVK